MTQFRPKLTLTVLVAITACCALVAFLVKCGNAMRDFRAKVQIVESALGTIVPEVDQELYETWLQNAQANPTFAAWVKRNNWESWSQENKVIFAVGNGGSGHSVAVEYFGSWRQDWTIVRYTRSPQTDYSRAPLTRGDTVIRVNVKITCTRPLGPFSPATSISIAENPSSDNNLLVERLRVKLGQNNTITDHADPDHGGRL